MNKPLSVSATLRVPGVFHRRRLVRQAAEAQAESTPTPAEVVARYVSGPLPRSKAESERVIAAMRTLRHDDDERRSWNTGA